MHRASRLNWLDRGWTNFCLTSSAIPPLNQLLREFKLTVRSSWRGQARLGKIRGRYYQKSLDTTASAGIWYSRTPTTSSQARRPSWSMAKAQVSHSPGPKLEPEVLKPPPIRPRKKLCNPPALATYALRAATLRPLSPCFQGKRLRFSGVFRFFFFTGFGGFLGVFESWGCFFGGLQGVGLGSL